jgi:hypothetical protein
VSHNVASLQGSLQKGPVPPTAPNPPTHIPPSTITQKAFVSNNVDYLQGSLQKGPTPPSAPNPATHNPTSTINQKPS